MATLHVEGELRGHVAAALKDYIDKLNEFKDIDAVQGGQGRLRPDDRRCPEACGRRGDGCGLSPDQRILEIETILSRRFLTRTLKRRRLLHGLTLTMSPAFSRRS